MILSKYLRLSLFLLCIINNSISCANKITITALEKNYFLGQSSTDFEQELQDLYLQSFKAVYKDNWSAKLHDAVVEGYNIYVDRYKNSDDMILITAKIEGTLAGWALFAVNQETQQSVLELISVSPNCWRQGVGKKLVFSIQNYFPQIKSIALVTRKINNISPLFYESLGFEKTNFCLPEYSPEEMQGYQYKYSNF